MNLSGPIYSAAGGHHAADGRDRPRRERSHSTCCRFRPLPQVDFPTISVSAGLPGASAGDHGLFGGHAAGAAVRPHRRRHGDDLVQLAGHHQHHPAVRPEPRTSTARRATWKPPSTRPAPICPPTCPSNPTYRKVNPADAPIMILGLTSDKYDRAGHVRRSLRPSCSRSSRRFRAWAR